MPQRIPKDPKKAYLLGFSNGEKTTHKDAVKEVRQDVLDFLEAKYMADDAPERGSAKANGILDLARDISSLLKVED